MNKQVHFENDSDNESLEINNIDKDLEENEQEILDDQEQYEELSENDLIANNVMNKFLEKYNHLDNSKSKKIIYKLCRILVEQIPEFRNNPNLYINTLESSIKELKDNKFEDLEK